MNGGYQVPVRLVVLLAGILVGILFLLGPLHWDAKPYSCFNGKHYYGDWVVMWKVGHQEFRAKAWGCDVKDRYDPKQFKPLYIISPPKVTT